MQANFDIQSLYVLFTELEGAAKMLQFILSLVVVYIFTMLAKRKIRTVFWKEVEVSGQKYFKKWYEVSLYSLFVNAVAFLISVFLCIKIFELDSFVEIGGLWAGILAFMWFTAPVWALDMIAWIIMLQSKNLETWDVFYIYENDLYVWIKSISLTEVKCIDLRSNNPIIFRPSKFRNLTFKNLSQWISGKNSKILRNIEICVDYRTDQKILRQICEEAFDAMHADRMLSGDINYFGEEPIRNLELQEFWDYGVKYLFFYTISSPFYVFSAQRLLNEYLLEKQKEYNVFFATPDLLKIEK